jgi:DNA sulfur modification protein DndD
MKLVRAQFQNFRLLRDLELKFSKGSERNLTVIRAANETGKTTILHALQWALYGDGALPGKGEDFRLYPIDWDINDGRRVPIMATVDFEVTNYRRGPTGLRETRHQYRIVRSAFEDVDGTTSLRSPSTVRLFELTQTGARPIDTPEALINEELPPELREIFFTDGDRALSFIEADVAQSTKRERVQRAIRSLLGLGVIEDAIRHVKKVGTEVNKKAIRVGADGKLNEIASRLEKIEDNVGRLELALEDAKQQFEAFEEQVNDTDRKIAVTLQKGDKEKLRKELDQAKQRIKQLDEQLAAASKEHAGLFRSRALATDLLAPVLLRAFGKLDELHDQGKIPNTTIPVLEDRLAAELCICGETLQVDSPDGQRRRQHIQKLIDDSRRADEIQEIVTELYYGAKTLQPVETNSRSQWLEDYEKVVKSRDGLQILRDEAGRELRAVELQLDALPDIDIKGLREVRREYLNQRDRFLQRRSEIETQLEGLQLEREEHSAERDRLLREQEKGARILSELEVTQDVIRVLEDSFKRITNDELDKVSDLMNGTFLEMIGADPEQGAIIKRAVITREFDIIVYGPNNQTLNPDRDLNGASRRALTLAFILALTKVSEVEAPNVIDTPLGMMSGYVKRSVLRTAIRESTQLILFLTHSEIAGCEEILDEAVGVICTLTNPAHYPKMLVNDPGVAERKVLSCACNHRTECRLCQRQSDGEGELEMESKGWR